MVISTNGESTWVATNYVGYYLWCVASSANGTTLVVGNSPYGILASTNSGATWAYCRTPFGAASLACSADGQKVVAGAGAGWGIWVSADAGINWNYAGIDGLFVESSADGSNLISAYNDISTSTNIGTTWITNTAPRLNWSAVASAADGHKFFAAVNSGGIWTRQITPKPELKLALTDNGFLISWIVPSMPFVLQESTDSTATDWTDVTTEPILNFTNLHYEVSVPVSTANWFYRLKRL